jgi:hypothetical protein
MGYVIILVDVSEVYGQPRVESFKSAEAVAKEIKNRISLLDGCIEIEFVFGHSLGSCAAVFLSLETYIKELFRKLNDYKKN